MLEIAVEAHVTRPIKLPLGTYIHCWLEQDGARVGHSFGQDEYHVTHYLPAGYRLTGLGRRYICQLEVDPLTNKPTVSLPSRTLKVNEGPNIDLILRTNILEILNNPDPPLVICVITPKERWCSKFLCLGGRTRYCGNTPELVVPLPVSKSTDD